MTKAAIFALMLAIFGCGGGSGGGSSQVVTPTIAIEDASPDVVVGTLAFTKARLEAYLPVMQEQIHEVAAAWGQKYDAKVVLGGIGDYLLVFRTGSDPSCGPSCHFFGDNGQPTATIYPAEAIASGNDPLLEAEHELVEMDIDPDPGQPSGPEIVDPVVCFTYCEGQPVIPGVPEQVCDGDNRVPDFILPGGGDFMGMGRCN